MQALSHRKLAVKAKCVRPCPSVSRVARMPAAVHHSHAGTTVSVVEPLQRVSQLSETVQVKPGQQSTSTAGACVEHLQPSNFQAFLQAAGDQLVLVDFYTDWCGPCQLMHKEMDKLTKAFPKGVHFAKFNCGLHEEFSTQQRIRSLPTFRLYKDGRCIDQVTGGKPIQLRQLLVHYWRPK